MREISKKLMVGIVVCLMIGTGFVAVGTMNVMGEQAPIVVLDDDWIIDIDPIIDDVTLNVPGNIVITSGGSLTLNNVNLILNPTYDGQHKIEIQSGGEIIINSCVIESGTNYNFVCNVLDGAIFEMTNSEWHDCGFDSPLLENTGLYIESNSTLIEGNEISSNYNGVVIKWSNPYIGNNTIMSNTGGAVILRNPAIRSIPGDGDTTLGDAEPQPQPLVPICQNSIIYGNTIIDNKIGVDFSKLANGTIKNNTIIENDIGISITNNSGPVISDNTISQNDDGIFIKWSNPYIENNTITSSTGGAIILRNPAIRSPGDEDSLLGTGGLEIMVPICQNSIIYGNIIIDNNVGIDFADLANGSIIGNSVINNEIGIRISNNSNPLIHYNMIYDNSAWNLFTDDDDTNPQPIDAKYNFWGNYKRPFVSESHKDVNELYDPCDLSDGDSGTIDGDNGYVEALPAGFSGMVTGLFEELMNTEMQKQVKRKLTVSLIAAKAKLKIAEYLTGKGNVVPSNILFDSAMNDLDTFAEDIATFTIQGTINQEDAVYLIEISEIITNHIKNRPA